MYLESSYQIFNFNFNFILPKVNTDYIRQAPNFILPKVNIGYIRRAHVMNFDNLTLIKILMKMFNENIKITYLKVKPV